MSDTKFSYVVGPLDMHKENHPAEIHLAVGTADVESQTTVDQIMRDCEQVLISGKNITDAVSISSVLPRIDNDLQNKTMDLNREL